MQGTPSSGGGYAVLMRIGEHREVGTGPTPGRKVHDAVPLKSVGRPCADA